MLSKQRKDLKRKSSGPGWIVTYREDALSVKNVPHPLVKPTMAPKKPWEEVAVDLMGPLPADEHLLVLVDYYSRWMEVDVTRTTSSK